MPSNIHEHLEVSLYFVEHAHYRSLHITGITYPHWIMSHVVSGHVETVTCGERWHAQSGDVIIHPPYLPFSEVASGEGNHQWLLFDVAISSNIDLFRIYPVAPVVSLSQHASEYACLFETLQKTWQSIAPTTTLSSLSSSTSSTPSLPLRNLQASALVALLCNTVLVNWQQAGSIPRPAALMTPQDRFLEVISYMSEHLDQKVSRESLAALVHLHPGYFDRIFHDSYGTTPMQMLRDLRLRRSLQLLETTDAPLTAIALSCGLRDAGYFSRVFRSHYGQTPGQYRQSAKNAQKSYIPLT